LDKECAQLLVDIHRIGEAGEPYVLEIFLMTMKWPIIMKRWLGPSKLPKKRGLITFQGQILLKGPHDKVENFITGNQVGDVPTLEKDREALITREKRKITQPLKT
jgi:hypothetical protein